MRFITGCLLASPTRPADRWFASPRGFRSSAPWFARSAPPGALGDSFASPSAGATGDSDCAHESGTRSPSTCASGMASAADAGALRHLASAASGGCEASQPGSVARRCRWPGGSRLARRTIEITRTLDGGHDLYIVIFGLLVPVDELCVCRHLAHDFELRVGLYYFNGGSL